MIQTSIKISTSLDPKRFETIKANLAADYKSLRIVTACLKYWVGVKTSNITFSETKEYKTRSQAIRRAEKLISSLGLLDTEVTSFEIYTWEKE